MTRGRTAALAALGLALLAPAPAVAFGYDDVREQARRLAAEPYREPAATDIPAALRGLGYDQYQAIRARPERTLWRERTGGLFRLQFFPVGFLFTRPVAVHLVVDGAVEEVDPRADLFDWSDAKLAEPPPDRIALAGLRVLFPLHRPDKEDEVASFLGASYFRILGREQAYGISARGLAVDTGMPRQEEFPWFRAFWVVAPAAGAREVTVFALLDSRSVAGAYRFVLRPGTETVAEVTATLIPRADVGLLGIAPLTSMFLAGENTQRRDGDFRPEVHDSDGLLVETGEGERLWRPLVNPRELRVSAFGVTNPRGFGLLQRDRAFASYQDLQARYHRRPSYWVEPIGDWGEGELRLLEIPSPSEIHDNISAFWVGRDPARKGETIERSYRLTAFSDPARGARGGRVVATRTGAVGLPGTAPHPRGARRFVVDFAGGDLDVLSPEQPVEGEVGVTGGKLLRAEVQPVPELGSWRLTLEVEPEGRGGVEMRGFLRLHGEALTETWTYPWRP